MTPTVVPVCCPSSRHEIRVRIGTEAVVLHRCAGCGDQSWSQGGVALPREQAFALLAEAFRDVPLRARAARDRATTASAARAAARAGATEVAAVPPLPDLLRGWRVLGATA